MSTGRREIRPAVSADSPRLARLRYDFRIELDPPTEPEAESPVGHLGRHGYISSLYVVPDLRNAGIGSALMEACLAECGRRGVDAVFLWPTARSRPLYLRHGFAVREDLLERRG